MAPQLSNPFGNNSMQLLNVDPWGSLGYAAPRPPDRCCFTQNLTLWTLGDEIGLCVLMAALDPVCRIWQPPSGPLMQSMAKMFNRGKTLIMLAMRLAGAPQDSTGKAMQSSRPWLIHPLPYFTGPMMQNKFMQELIELAQILLINLYQTTGNALGEVVTEDVAGLLMSFLNPIGVKLGTELGDLNASDILADQFLFDVSDAGPFGTKRYRPYDKVINKEALYDQGPTVGIPTLQNHKRLIDGIPANLIISMLAQFPVGPVPSASGLQGDPMMKHDQVLAYQAAQASNDGTATDALDQAIAAAMANAPQAPSSGAPTGSAVSGAAGAPQAQTLPVVPKTT
jgi:hypothetical protein